MESPFKYIYQGKEVSKEEFTSITKEMFKWFDSNTINAVDYSSVSDFLGENYKSKGEINKHLKGVLDGFDSQKWGITQSNFSLEDKIKKFYLLNLPDWNKEHNQLVEECFNICGIRTENELHNYFKAQTNDELKKILHHYEKYENLVLKKTADNNMKQKFAEAGAKAGEKHNKLKVPLDILQTRQFPKALQLLALATSYGNYKYKNTDLDFLNFKRVEGGSQTYLDASARHSTDRNALDSESGLHHIIHGVWNQIAALEIWAEENKINIEEYSKNYLENLQNQK